MSSELRDNMFAEMRNKAIFDLARDAAYACADSVNDRPVFPGDSACGDDDTTAAVIAEVQRSGDCWVGGTRC